MTRDTSVSLSVLVRVWVSMCETSGSGWLDWRQQLVQILLLPWEDCGCVVGRWVGSWDGGGGYLTSRKQGPLEKQWLPLWTDKKAKGATPSAHHPPTPLTARCNSTPEITITPWAFGVPRLPLSAPPLLQGHQGGGNTFTSMRACLEASHSSAGADNWLTHLHRLCFKACFNACLGNVRRLEMSKK